MSRRSKDPRRFGDPRFGLTAEECTLLARFNDEVFHGIQHTDEYRQQMAVLQETFDRVKRETLAES